MNRKTIALIVTWYAVVLTLSLMSCVNLGDTASTCMDSCTTTTKACLDTSNESMLKCKDSTCEHVVLYAAEGCLTDAMGCVAQCVKIVERKLK